MAKIYYMSWLEYGLLDSNNVKPGLNTEPGRGATCLCCHHTHIDTHIWTNTHAEFLDRPPGLVGQSSQSRTNTVISCGSIYKESIYPRATYIHTHTHTRTHTFGLFLSPGGCGKQQDIWLQASKSRVRRQWPQHIWLTMQQRDTCTCTHRHATSLGLGLEKNIPSL